MTRKRYALVGAGARAAMYVGAITGRYKAEAELVAWSDTNPGRLDHYERLVSGLGMPTPARFAPDQLGQAIAEHRIDRVIVTSPDFRHAGHVAAALAAAADVLVEKPLVIDEGGVKVVADAVAASGRQVQVGFNYRYAPRNSALRRLIKDGAIGQVTSVHFEWLLDTAHGADYFRRWHRNKQHSGGLLVHKASHHFDLVNWWLADTPLRVFASGGLRFYGADNARLRGLAPRPDRGSIDDDRRDFFSLDMRLNPELKGLYFDQEGHDGYLRDMDVFGDGITIEDNLSLVVDYARGASMSYTLCAHAPWEGYIVAVNGTKGRAELTVVERGAVLFGEDEPVIVDPTAQPLEGPVDAVRPNSERLVVQRHFEPATIIPIPVATGGHGGGDALLLADVLLGAAPDPLNRAADWRDGVRALAVGLAANRSLESGLPVRIADLDFGANNPLIGS